MSSDETQSALSRAYSLVEAGNYGEARAILEPILAANKNNADAWWIYAHAVDDPEAGREALENVVRIDPRYPGASELLTQAQERFPAKPKITSLVRPISVPEAPQHLPEVLPPDATSEQVPVQRVATQPARDTRGQFAAAPPPQAAAQRRSSLPLIAVLVVIIIIAAAAIFLLTQNGGAPPATPTAAVVALASDTPLPIEAATVEVTSTSESALTTAAPTESIATLEPTLAATEAVTAELLVTQTATKLPTAEVVATQAPTEVPTEANTATQVPTEVPLVQNTATEAPTELVTAQAAATEAPTQAPTVTTAEATAQSAADSFATIEKALSEFSLAESGVGEVTTSLGDTVLVTVCSTPGRAMRALLPKAMNTLAKVSPALGTTVDALGVRMLDCGTNAPLLTVAVELTTAQSYAKGDLTDSAFAATWKPQ